MSHNALFMCVGDHTATGYLRLRKTEIIWKVTSSHKKHRDDFLALIMFDQLLFVFPFLLRNSSNLKRELLIMTQAENKLKEWCNKAAQTKNCSRAGGRINHTHFRRLLHCRLNLSSLSHNYSLHITAVGALSHTRIDLRPTPHPPLCREEVTFDYHVNSKCVRRTNGSSFSVTPMMIAMDYQPLRFHVSYRFNFHEDHLILKNICFHLEAEFQ